MTELVNATYVRTDRDWEGLYVDGVLHQENHSISLEDVELPEGKAIDSVNKESYDIQRIGKTGLPTNLDHLERLLEFSDKVENKYGQWEMHVTISIEDHEKEYVTTEEADDIFNVDDGEGEVLIALFSKIDPRNSLTPLGKEPILEIDHDHSESGSGLAAYTLK